MSSDSHIDALAYADGKPPLTAWLKTYPHDFQVEETLGFTLDEQGSHDYLLIRKQQLNTETVAGYLAKYAGVKPVAIGYAGLKDKYAVTSQWFSVNLAGKAQPDWQGLNQDTLQVVDVRRHSRKLKRGAIKSNCFNVVLRNLEGDRDCLRQCMETIEHRGVPNYFAGQRFGRADANLKKARKLFAGEMTVKNRHQRGLYLSAARAYLFNQLLSQRVTAGSWDKILPGEACVLAGSKSFFVVDDADSVDESIIQRLDCWDLHPSGALWGAGDLPSAGASRALEEQLKQQQGLFCEGLVKAGMKQQRRALRLKVHDLQWHMAGDEVTLRFDLASGTYATTVLREIVQATQPKQRS